MKNTLTSVAFNRFNAFFVGEKEELDMKFNRETMTFVDEMANLGFVVSKELYTYLSNKPAQVAETLLNLAKVRVGANVEHRVLYPNFPTQVMEASEAELFFNAIMHYWSNGRLVPDYEKLARPVFKEKNKGIDIGVATTKDMKAHFSKILSSKDSIPSDLTDFVKDGLELGWLDEFSGIVEFKETLAFVVKYCINKGIDAQGMFRTTTDVLRAMVAMSDGDVSLKTKVKFKSLPRSQRRVFVNALNHVISIEDVKRHKDLWIKAFHSLHVGEFKGKAREVASRFRNENNVETMNTKVMEAIKNSDPMASKLLMNVPSIFARNLDKVLRDAKTDAEFDQVLERFALVAEKVSPKILVQLLGHLKRRVDDLGERMVITNKAMFFDGLKGFGEEKVTKVVKVVISALVKIFAENPKLKDQKVFIGESVDGILMPTQMKSSNGTKRSIARGSRLPMDHDKKIIRAFTHWVGQDIDLSAVLFKDNWKNMTAISYYNLREGDWGVHSGDITYAPAPTGGSEFIDVNIERLLKKGYRYLSIDLRVFNGPNFVEHERCFAGFMYRNDLKSGEIFEPRSVVDKFDVMMESRAGTVAVFDLKEREMIWVDMPMISRSVSTGNNVHNNVDLIVQQLRNAVAMRDQKISIKDLVELHVKASGAEIVKSKEEATFVVDLTDEADLNPTDFISINSEWI